VVLAFALHAAPQLAAVPDAAKHFAACFSAFPADCSALMQHAHEGAPWVASLDALCARGRGGWLAHLHTISRTPVALDPYAAVSGSMLATYALLLALLYSVRGIIQKLRRAHKQPGAAMLARRARGVPEPGQLRTLARNTWHTLQSLRLWPSPAERTQQHTAPAAAAAPPLGPPPAADAASGARRRRRHGGGGSGVPPLLGARVQEEPACCRAGAGAAYAATREGCPTCARCSGRSPAA
jgi:hypothetical protein